MKFTQITNGVLAMLCMAAAHGTANADETAQRDLVAVSDSGRVCPLDYEVLSDNPFNPNSGLWAYGDDIIEVLEQNTDTVKFRVKQLFSATGTTMFVDYRTDNLGTTSCEEHDGTNLPGDIVITAQCMATVPQTIVDVYAIHPFANGDVDVPECCHGTSPPTKKARKYSFLISCVPKCDEDPPSDCPEVVLNFNDLPELSYVHDEYQQSMGVLITAKGKGTRYTPMPKANFPVGSDWKKRYGFNGSTDRSSGAWEDLHESGGGAARVFNTLKPDKSRGNNYCYSNSSHGDKDLGSPNVNCPAGTPGLVPRKGPGHGDGGVPSASWGWPNCPAEQLGKILIIQETRYSCADDTGGGGYITFDFDDAITGPVQITLVKIPDTDHKENTPDVKVWKSNENVNQSPAMGKFDTAKTGDNGLYFKDFSQDKQLADVFSGVRRIQFEYFGSGSIAEVRFKPSKCPA